MSALSPYAVALGVEPAKEAGGPLRLPFGDALVGRPSFLHGGAIAGLLEAAAQQAIAEARGGEGLKSVTTTFEFLRGGRPLTTYARATVTRLGRRVASVEARAWQEDEAKPIGLARVTFVVSPPG